MNVPHKAPSGELKKSKGSLDLNGVSRQVATRELEPSRVPFKPYTNSPLIAPYGRAADQNGNPPNR